MHESIHRGIEKLQQSPLGNKDWPASASDHTMNEMVVRKLMHDKFGADEQNKYQDKAVGYFKNENFPHRQKMIDAMEAAAALLHARNRPVSPDHPWVKATTESVRGPR